jgi:hypothetical protein
MGPVIDREADATVTLRAAERADAPALERIAQLDSRPLPPGPHLLAERTGGVEAAISLRTGEIVANPFVRTADLRDLLRMRARSAIAAEPAGRNQRLLPIPVTA